MTIQIHRKAGRASKVALPITALVAPNMSTAEIEAMRRSWESLHQGYLTAIPVQTWHPGEAGLCLFFARVAEQWGLRLR